MRVSFVLVLQVLNIQPELYVALGSVKLISTLHESTFEILACRYFCSIFGDFNII